MVWYVLQKPNLLFALCKPLPITNKPTSSTPTAARPEWGTSRINHRNHRKFKRGPMKMLCLCLIIIIWILASAVLLFTPTESWDKVLQLRSGAFVHQHGSAHTHKNGPREGRGEEAKLCRAMQKKCNISDPEHKVLLLKALVKPGVFLWDTETLLSLQIFESGRVVCWSGKCHFPLTTCDIKNTGCLGWLHIYMYVSVHIYILKRNIIMLKTTV